MRRAALLVLVAALSFGCARRGAVSTPVRTSDAGGGSPPTVQVGQASWYGDPYHGRRAASGETFDKNKLTAAHRTLPFDTWVRVENQLNNRTVDVRINDRGPFVEGRIIDLSQRAAEELDMIRAGVVPVRVQVIQEPERADAASSPPDSRGVEDVFYVVQLGAFRSPDRARDLARRLEGKYTGIYVERPSGNSELYRVRIGRARLAEARDLQNLLRTEEDIDAIVQEVSAED